MRFRLAAGATRQAGGTDAITWWRAKIFTDCSGYCGCFGCRGRYQELRDSMRVAGAAWCGHDCRQGGQNERDIRDAIMCCRLHFGRPRSGEGCILPKRSGRVGELRHSDGSQERKFGSIASLITSMLRSLNIAC
jgi:hypothetical protein